MATTSSTSLIVRARKGKHKSVRPSSRTLYDAKVKRLLVVIPRLLHSLVLTVYGLEDTPEFRVMSSCCLIGVAEPLKQFVRLPTIVQCSLCRYGCV